MQHALRLGRGLAWARETSVLGVSPERKSGGWLMVEGAIAFLNAIRQRGLLDR
jgi:hypothetical protein